MNKNIKRIMAIMLSAVMIFGCIPSHIVSADSPESDWSILAKYMNMDTEDESPNQFGDITNNGELLFHVTADGVREITLKKNITAGPDDNSLVVSTLTQPSAVVLNLNGYILNRGLIDLAGNPTPDDDGRGSVIKVVEDGRLYIKDVCDRPVPSYKGKIENGVWVYNPDLPDGEGVVTIQGGIIMGGTGTINGGKYEGGAIKLEEDSLLNISGGTICGNYADNGGAIHVSETGVVSGMNDGSISYNKAETHGGGIYIDGVSNSFSLEGGTVSNNIALNGNGGGIYNNGRTTLNDDATVSNNEAKSGGGIYNVGSGSVTLNGGTVSNNIATNNGGGIYNDDNGITTLNGGTISNNTATNNGGGIYNEDAGITTLNWGTISSNTAANNGGGIYNVGSGSVTLNGGTVSNNTATNNGGGICNEGIGIIVLKGGTISNNTATVGGSGIHTGAKLDLIKGVIENNANPAIQKAGVNSGNFIFTQNELVFDGSIKDSSDGKVYYLVNVDSDYIGKLDSTPAYGEKDQSVTINAHIPYAYLTVNGEKIDGNTFTLGEESVTISLVEPQGSSYKKYKAINVNDADIKITGSEKKGSTRTVTLSEEKELESISVYDKDGNDIKTAKKDDLTYTFIQPAKDVYVEVIYKNKLIVLNIGSTKASVNGIESNLDVCPVTRNDRTMLPIRYVAENLGAKVEWDEKEPTIVKITKGDKVITITLGSNIAKVNDKEFELDSVAFAENNRTYLPVRFIAENLDATVTWNEKDPNKVTITAK